MKKRDRTRPRPATLTEKEIAIRDRIRESGLKWKGKPPGIPPAMARNFERQIEQGKTVRDLTSVPLKSYMVPNSRFLVHCRLNPEWGARIQKLSNENASKKKTLSHHKRAMTQETCLKGLHPMKGRNLMIHMGRRRCRACFLASKHGKPMTREMKAEIVKTFEEGASLGQIVRGFPTGGGRRDRSLIITNHDKLDYERKTDPEFGRLIDKHIADSNAVGMALRYARDGYRPRKDPDAVVPPEIKPAIITVARLKHRIRTIAGGKYARALKRQDKKRHRRNCGPVWNR